MYGVHHGGLRQLAQGGHEQGLQQVHDIGKRGEILQRFNKQLFTRFLERNHH
jgi:hypothetical protein